MLAPILDEMRALHETGVIALSAEAELALTTQYAALTAHGTGWLDN